MTTPKQLTKLTNTGFHNLYVTVTTAGMSPRGAEAFACDFIRRQAGDWLQDGVSMTTHTDAMRHACNIHSLLEASRKKLNLRFACGASC